MKTKIPKEVLQFFLENGIIVDIVEGQKKYTFLPYWFEVIDAEKGIVIFHSLENVPDELKEAITEKREVVKPTEFYQDDIDLYFEEAGYEGRAEEALDKIISYFRHAQQEYENGNLKVSGFDELAKQRHANLISGKLYFQLHRLISNPDLEYTIVHKKDDKASNSDTETI